MHIQLAQQPIGLAAIADIQLLGSVFVVEDFHPPADQRHGRIEQPVVHYQRAVLVDPAANSLSEIIVQIIRSIPQALYFGGKTRKRALSGRGVSPPMVLILDPKGEGEIDRIESFAFKERKKLSPYGFEKSFDFPLYLLLVWPRESVQLPEKRS
jgi:hypothetical protein